MKLSTIVVMLLALALSSTAYAAKFVVIKMEDGHEMYFGRNMFATGANGRTDMYRDGSKCAMLRHDDQSQALNDCKTMWAELQRMQNDMMEQHGMTQADMMANMPKGSSEVRKIGNKVVAKYNTVCYEAGQWGEIVACFSPEVHSLIKKTMAVDPQSWMKDFQIDKMPGRNLTDQALAKLQHNAFLMLRANYLRAAGLNPFFVSNMPDAKVKQMVKDSKARGEPPSELKVVAIETKSMNINRHSSYKNVPLKQFIAGGMGGGSGSDMGTAGMPAIPGGDLNLEAVMQQQGAAGATANTQQSGNGDSKTSNELQNSMKKGMNKLKGMFNKKNKTN